MPHIESDHIGLTETTVRTEGALTLEHAEVLAQQAMQAEILAALNAQERESQRLGGRQEPGALVQLRKDTATILAMAGLRMTHPDDETVIITGLAGSTPVDLKGRVGFLSHPSNRHSPIPQLLAAEGTVGDTSFGGGKAIEIMGNYRFFLRLRQERAERIVRGIPPHMSA